MSGRAGRARETLAALRESRRLERHDAWGRGRLGDHRRELLLGMLRHAKARSPHYREALAGVALDDDLDVAELPTLDKGTLLERFDEIVTDPRLTLAGVESHLEGIASGTGDERLLGSYRAMASGGTTGRRGVFVYGAADWTRVLGGLMRWTGSYLGLAPRLPRRRRLAAVVADSPLHMTARMGRSLDTGVHRILRLDARTPLPRLAEELDAFRPEGLTGYSSVVALLADEQIAGRLRIDPVTVATTSEVRTPEMEQRIVAAWGRKPFNGYATTETGMLATDCDRHAGMHVLEDLALLEVVDGECRPVAPGTPGAKVLVTNLVNRTQPLIRFELTDLVTVSPDPCPCGRPFPVLSSVDGRSDDILSLPARGGGTVAVHPLTLRSPLAGMASLRQYRIVHDHRGLTVEAVLRPGARDVSAEVARRLGDALSDRGVEPPAIAVVPVAAIERHPGSGKAKLVESRLSR